MHLSRTSASGSASISSRRPSSRATWSFDSRSSMAASVLRTEHRRVHLLQRLALAEIHVHAAGQARVEAADRAHDVDAPEVLLVVLLEDRLAHHRVLVWTRSPIAVRRTAVPGSQRVRVVVRDLAVADHHVVGEHAPDGLVEAAADALVGHVEVLEHLRVARADLLQALVE